MNVAPLKLLYDQPLKRKHRGFPRLNERGSIEARLDALDRRWRTAFPRLNERGSIEADD